MVILKTIIYVLIFATSSVVGILYSQKYVKREKELEEFKNALTIFKTKIKYTYAPLAEIFEDISKSTKGNISKLFQNICKNMQQSNVIESFSNAIENEKLSLNNEDKQYINGLSKMLGKTDIEGQISQIELCLSFLNIQIEKAHKERAKNEKLYKTLGIATGLGIVIILL